MVALEQMKSPFYFKAHSTALTKGTTSNDVFLKVWYKDDVDLDHLLLEWENHRRAFKTGVPVAAPVLDSLVSSTSPSGSTYLVFASEYLQVHMIQDETAFFEFCTSFIKTVIKLHVDAGLLHCDLKPANMCWAIDLLV